MGTMTREGKEKKMMMMTKERKEEKMTTTMTIREGKEEKTTTSTREGKEEKTTLTTMTTKGVWNGEKIGAWREAIETAKTTFLKRRVAAAAGRGGTSTSTEK